MVGRVEVKMRGTGTLVNGACFESSRVGDERTVDNTFIYRSVKSEALDTVTMIISVDRGMSRILYLRTGDDTLIL